MSEVVSQSALTLSGMVFAGLWEGAVIVTAVWLILRAFPRLGASTRYAVWLSTLIMLAIAPVCTIALSAPHGSQATVESHNAVAAGDSYAAASKPVAMPRESTGQSGPQPLLNATPSLAQERIDIPLDLSLAIAVLWLLSMSARFVVLSVHLRRLATLRRSAVSSRVAYGYPVLTSQRTSVPLAVGFVHPAVVLPSSLYAELSPEALDAIVMHEVAHLRRYDVWTNAVARVLEALLVLNPFAWYVLSRLSVEREVACDDWVVARLDAGEVFANTLANMALRRAPTPIAAPSAIGSKHTVVARIERLLDQAPRRLRLSPVAIASVVLLLAMFAAIVPSVSPVLAFAAPQTPASSSVASCNHPALLQDVDLYLRPTGRWIPVSSASKNAGDPRNTVLALTIDATGKLTKSAVISSPHPRDARAAQRFFAMLKYRPAVVNCKAVASTVRIAGLISIAPPAPISIVRATYPNGWSSAHPGACRVPDLTHGGVPDVQLVDNKQVTASVLVHVDGAGKVTNATLSKSSGNVAYDDATLAAARAGTYPLGDGFKPVRPSGTTLGWNATHGYSFYSRCTPLPTEYTWTTTFPRADQ